MTAYELRISDLSSDVCSSDLCTTRVTCDHRCGIAPANRRTGVVAIGGRQAAPPLRDGLGYDYPGMRFELFTQSGHKYLARSSLNSATNILTMGYTDLSGITMPLGRLGRSPARFLVVIGGLDRGRTTGDGKLGG